MANVYFLQLPEQTVLRVAQFNFPLDSDTMSYKIREAMRELCDIHAAFDAVEENRVETCRGNLVVYMRFLDIT